LLEIQKDDEQGNYTISSWKKEEINHQEILDFVYKTALEKGADAITHFKIKNVERVINDGIENVYLQGLEVEGLLIKRK
jgi:hypothetical protein